MILLGTLNAARHGEIFSIIQAQAAILLSRKRKTPNIKKTLDEVNPNSAATNRRSTIGTKAASKKLNIHIAGSSKKPSIGTAVEPISERCFQAHCIVPNAHLARCLTRTLTVSGTSVEPMARDAYLIA
jgi:hypothetical protein